MVPVELWWHFLCTVRLLALNVILESIVFSAKQRKVKETVTKVSAFYNFPKKIMLITLLHAMSCCMPCSNIHYLSQESEN